MLARSLNGITSLLSLQFAVYSPSHVYNLAHFFFQSQKMCIEPILREYHAASHAWMLHLLKITTEHSLHLLQAYAST